jgi:hypothetical protein
VAGWKERENVEINNVEKTAKGLRDEDGEAGEALITQVATFLHLCKCLRKTRIGAALCAQG